MSFPCFSQDCGKENLNLVFYNDCSGEIENPKFEIMTFPEDNNKYVTVYVNRGNFIGQYSTTLKSNNDTIRIPKILFSFGNELHSKRWNYLNCNEICNGNETDFYPNGNKRLEGIFKNGKPIEIKEYRQDGNLLTQIFYKNGSLDFNRINYFNEKEELTEYKVFKNGKKKTHIKTFDKNGNLIDENTIEN